MNSTEQKAIFLVQSLLIQKLDADAVSRYLFNKSVIQLDHLIFLQKQRTTLQRRMYLIELIQCRRDGWNGFCNALVYCGQKILRDQLEKLTQKKKTI